MPFMFPDVSDIHIEGKYIYLFIVDAFLFWLDINFIYVAKAVTLQKTLANWDTRLF